MDGGNQNPFGEPVDDPLEDSPFGDNAETFSWGEWEETEAFVDEVSDEVCDHDDHKEVVTEQTSAGASFMGTGVQGGTSVTKIVCKKCAQSWEVEEATNRTNDGFGF